MANRIASATSGIGAMPHRSLGTLPTTAPTDVTEAAAANTAHGIVPRSGYIAVAVSAAASLTCYLYCKALNKWVTNGGPTTKTTIAFAASGAADWQAPEGELFYIVSDTGSITGATNADAVPSYR